MQQVTETWALHVARDASVFVKTLINEQLVPCVEQTRKTLLFCRCAERWASWERQVLATSKGDGREGLGSVS